MKRVLLAVCGLTPQIITETLYALHCEGRLPQRVVVLTTRAGRERCLNTLFGGPGMLHRFFDDYGIAPSVCRFGREDILTPAPPADDIATLEESEAFQTLCMEQTRLIAGEPDVTVDFSIAGGRKTMGASLALAAQCYAGAEDRLFHVLVSPAFESQPDFSIRRPAASSCRVRLPDRRWIRGTPASRWQCCPLRTCAPGCRRTFCNSRKRRKACLPASTWHRRLYCA